MDRDEPTPSSTELEEPWRATGECAKLELPPLSILDRRRVTRMASSSPDSIARVSQSMGSALEEEPLPEPNMVAADGAEGRGADGERTGSGTVDSD